MAWTAPVTFVAGNALTAAQLNTYLRDNLNETAPAKATTAGYHFVSTGVNSIAERGILKSAVTTSESTTSTSYVNLATVGPAVTLTTGTKALMWWRAYTQNNTIDTATWMAPAITGASSITATDASAASLDGVTAANAFSIVGFHMEDGLTPGVNTFTLQYRVTAGTGTYGFRELCVMAL